MSPDRRNRAARAQMLGRIRSALGPTPDVPDVPRDYTRAGQAMTDRDELVARLVNRLEDYRATVIRSTRDGIAQAVASGLGVAGRVVVPPGLPGEWLPDGLDVLVDDGADAIELDACDAVVTASRVAVAETGTIVLDGEPDQGRRALSLVPDLHVCVVREDQVVDDVPAGVAAVDPRRPLTWISGPSATSDIELNRVEGVHGPRTLVVVLVSEP